MKINSERVPEMDGKARKNVTWQSWLRRYSSAMGNFSIQYNMSSLAMVTILLTSSTQVGDPVISEPEWAQDVLLGVIFAGCLFGMLFMGFIGDMIGRQHGLALTTFLMVFFVLGSAFFTWVDGGFWEVLIVCRFFMGVGIGGVYPLAATSAAENDETEDKDIDQNQKRTNSELRVGWAFFWQSPGVAAPYALCYILVNTGLNAWPIFRIQLAMGALPALYVFLCNLKLPSSNAGQDHQHLTDADPESGRSSRAPILSTAEQSKSPPPVSSEDVSMEGNPKDDSLSATTRSTNYSSPTWSEGIRDWTYWKYLIGTGGSWFIYDVVYYGISIFSPYILEKIFQPTNDGNKVDIYNLCLVTMVTFTVAVIGAACGVLWLRRWSLKSLNSYGFLLIAFSFMALAITEYADPKNLYKHSAAIKFSFFCLLLSSLNFGPSVATYVLPTQVFPVEVRSTFHGLSAACAKIGAVVGTFFYPWLHTHVSVANIMTSQACLCVLGFVISSIFIPRATEVDFGIKADRFTRRKSEDQLGTMPPLE